MARFAFVAGMCLWCGMTMAQSAVSPAPAASSGERVIVVRPAGPELTPGMLVQKHGGSLLKATVNAQPDPSRPKLAGLSFMAVPDPEPKVIKKHDLVTIIVRENTEFTSDGTTELKKDADLDARLDEWIKLNPGNFALEGGAQGSRSPSVKMSGSRNFKGEATVDRTDSFVTRITAEVVDVKLNGTFAVQARKFIKHDDEEQEYLLTGVCRAADLTPDNTILSTQVHDLQINTTHKGAVHDTNKRGLIPKLLDLVNPF